MKRWENYSRIILFLFLLTGITACREEPATVKSHYYYTKPQYNQAEIKASTDTITFFFPDTLYFKIETFNTFISEGIEYIAFFDEKELYKKKEQSLLIYNFSIRDLITRIPVKRFFDNSSSYYTTTHVINFDSIFVFTKKDVRLYDSSGLLKKIVRAATPKPLVNFFNNGHTPVLAGNQLYTGVRIPIEKKNIEHLRKQALLYNFDMLRDTATLHYQLPDLYYTTDYGHHYLGNAYCYNDSGRFVFSFGADTTLYETDLGTVHNSYYAKSSFHTQPLEPVTAQGSSSFSAARKNYYTQEAYGVIYFDKFRKRYLRVVLRGQSEADYVADKQRSQTVLIFDNQFHVVGESPVPDGIDMERLFFTDNGTMYAERLPKLKSAIRFVRLEYGEKQNHLTQKP